MGYIIGRGGVCGVSPLRSVVVAISNGVVRVIRIMGVVGQGNWMQSI